MIRLNAPKAREKSAFTIKDLKGLDAWNNPVSVSPERATSMRNIVNRNGVNHKRHGWEQTEDVFPGAIDGYYVGRFHGKTYEIVYAACNFFVKTDGILSSTTYTNSDLISNPAKFYEQDGKVFIIGCGDYLVFVPERNGTFAFVPVAESVYAYVPLTFISDYCNSDRGLAVLAGEKSNMLSSYRINKFYDADCSEISRKYRLDAYTDEPTVEPVVNDVLSTQVTWTDAEGKENVFSVIENNEAYLLIADNVDRKTSGFYKFTYNDTQYFLSVSKSDTHKTGILLRRSKNGFTTISNIRSSTTTAPSANSEIYASQLVKTGFASKNLYYGYDIGGHTLFISGKGTAGTLRDRIEFTYADSAGAEKNVKWEPITDDWNACRLTDGTNTYAIATRENWLYRYDYWAGKEMKTKFPDGYGGQAYTYADSVVFPAGSTFVCDYDHITKKLFDATHKKVEGPFCYGYTLAYTSEDGEETHVGTICPYTGEITVVRHISETWGGIGAEKLPSIVVKYKAHNPDAGKIEKCTASTLFGLNGNSDRLFVGGNPDYPNADWHSGYTDKDGKSGNFCYFESGSSAYLGSPSSAIKGYQRLSDGQLAVYKERSNKEATLYIRSGVSETDASGRIIEYYPNNGGYITEGAVNAECFGVLGTDMLMLSENGVFGLEISENVASQQRFLKERSKPVAPLLKKHSLNDARAVVFDDKYFLAVDDKVYVADGRFMRKESGDMPDTFSYEWYVFDNCPVRTWITDGKRLGFGTNEGRICFFNDGYADSCYVNVKYPNFGFDRYYGPAVMIITGDIVIPPTGEIDGKIYNRTIFKGVLGGIVGPWTFSFSVDYASVKYNGSSDEYTERFLYETVKKGDYIYFTSDYEGTCNGKRKVLSVDYDNLEIICEHTPGEKWMIAQNGDKHTETEKPPNIDFILVPIGNGFFCPRDNGIYFAVKSPGLSFSGVWFDNEELAKAAPDISMKIYGDVPVTATWKTGALNFGTNYYVKQLESVTTLTEGKMKVSFETRSGNGYSIEIKNTGRPFDLENLNLEEIAFSNLMSDENGSSLCSRSVKKTFGTLVLRIENDADEDFVLHEITFIYKLLRRMKGER